MFLFLLIFVQVLELTGEYIAEPSRVLLCYYNETQDCLDTYYSDGVCISIIYFWD